MSSVTRWLRVGAGAVLIGSVLFGRNPHPHVPWEAIPAYGALFGFAGTYLIVFLAKAVLAPRLRRDDRGEG